MLLRQVITGIDCLVRASAGLDAAFFGTAAPGILNGLTPVVASVSTDPQTALLADLSALLQDLDQPSPDVIFAMAPSSYLVASALLPPTFGYQLTQSTELAAGTVVAVDAAGVAAALGAERVSTSNASTFHEDDDPPALSVAGSPNTIAAPTRSLFQTDSLGARIIAPISWVARSGAVAFMAGAGW